MKTDSALAALAALAQETRLAIFQLLVRYEPEGLTVGEIAQHLDLAPATLSFHLKTLTQAGLVSSEQDGRHIHCRAQIEAVQALGQFLIMDCCKGQPERCKPASSSSRRSKAA